MRVCVRARANRRVGAQKSSSWILRLGGGRASRFSTLLGGNIPQKSKQTGLCEAHLEISIAPSTSWGSIDALGSSDGVASEESS